jgi:NADPH:quinone reductase-like Zn-dependent oxidoreductase
MKRILKWIFRIVLVLFSARIRVCVCRLLAIDQRCAAKRLRRQPMKAIVRCDYGWQTSSCEIVKSHSDGRSDPGQSSRGFVNPYDWHFVEGTPYVMRVMGVGLRKPKEIRLGVDFAGTVEAVGKNVTQFKPGDDVFGGRDGAFAEYVCRRAVGAVAPKPTGLTFEQAASINIAGITALQGVRDKGKVQPGQKVLINGASGGVGTFAVQIAKSFGAEITGVCSTRNLELVQSLGADHVIDYTKEDFTKGDQHYDVILDNVGNRSLSEYRRLLTPNGIYVLIGGGGASDQGFLGGLAKALDAAVYSKFVKQKMGMMMADPSTKDLTLLADMVQSGKIKPVIDRTYKSLSEVPDAIRYVEEGHARGKSCNNC